VYEELFDSLNDAKDAFNSLEIIPDWLAEVQTVIEGVWAKLRK